MLVSIFIAFSILLNFAVLAENEELSLKDLLYLSSDESNDANKFYEIVEKLAKLDDKKRDDLTKKILESKRMDLLLNYLYLNDLPSCLNILHKINLSNLSQEMKIAYMFFFASALKNPHKYNHDEELQKMFTDFISICLDDKSNEVVSTAVYVANKCLLKGLVDKMYVLANNPKNTLEIRVNAISYLLNNAPENTEKLKVSIRKDIEMLHDIEQQLEYASKIKDRTLTNKILIEGLMSDIPEKRLFSFLYLNKITGKTFYYNPIGTRQEIEESAMRWKDYLEGRVLKDEK